MNDPAFGAWPVRFFVLQPELPVGGTGQESEPPRLRLVFKAQPHEDDNMYHASDLAAWLEEHA